MAPILVTGSAGFIGFHLCRRLLTEGREVVGVDDFNGYYAPELKRARTEILKSSDNFVSVEMDLADRAAVERCFQDHRPELICHLAAQPGVRYSLVNPFAYEKSNVAAFFERDRTGPTRFHPQVRVRFQFERVWGQHENAVFGD